MSLFVFFSVSQLNVSICKHMTFFTISISSAYNRHQRTMFSPFILINYYNTDQKLFLLRLHNGWYLQVKTIQKFLRTKEKYKCRLNFYFLKIQSFRLRWAITQNKIPFGCPLFVDCFHYYSYHTINILINCTPCVSAASTVNKMKDFFSPQISKHIFLVWGI